MENQIEHNQDPDEEISLIDLFAVLVRYRKLIVIGTILITFLAGLYLFVLPMLRPSSNKMVSEVTYSATINKIPSTVERELPNGSNVIYRAVQENILNPAFFASVYKEYPVFSTSPVIDETELNKTVLSLIEDKKIDVKQGPLGATVEITVTVANDKLAETDALVSALISRTNENMESFLISQFEELREVTLGSIAMLEAQTLLLDNSTQGLQRLLLDLEQYMANLDKFVWLEGAPFVVPVAQGDKVKLIIVVFAAFFVTVFLAFVLNAIRNIKADPQASKILSEAWKAGK